MYELRHSKFLFTQASLGNYYRITRKSTKIPKSVSILVSAGLSSKNVSALLLVAPLVIILTRDGGSDVDMTYD